MTARATSRTLHVLSDGARLGDFHADHQFEQRQLLYPQVGGFEAVTSTGVPTLRKDRFESNACSPGRPLSATAENSPPPSVELASWSLRLPQFPEHLIGLRQHAARVEVTRSHRVLRLDHRRLRGYRGWRRLRELQFNLAGAPTHRADDDLHVPAEPGNKLKQLGFADTPELTADDPRHLGLIDAE